MGIAAGATRPTAVAEGDGAAASGRRPWWIWAVPFATLFAVLVARNAYLFSTRLYEQGDSGANSILIQQALRFKLLVGHYSREKFNHPGPAYLYAQALGQWVARDVLHAVPTPWNGQLLAVYALASAMLALAAGVVYGVVRSSGTARAVACAAGLCCAVLGFAAWHPDVVTSNWMPDLLVLTFLVFLLAAASVAARQSRDLWILALSGCMLIHGYAPNLLFVPLVAVAVGLAALWPWRRRPLLAIARFAGGQPRAWVPAVVIVALFALPIVVNTLAHWPGEFGKYFAYNNSHKAGGHGISQVAHYVGWYWWPHGTGPALAVAVGLCVAALAVALTLTHGTPRLFALALIAVDLLTTVAFVYYAAFDIDGLAYYIGFFYWAVPVSMALVVVVGLIAAAPPAVSLPTALVATAAAAIAFAVFANLHSDIHDNDPQIPGAVAAVAARDPGKPVVITSGLGQSWVEIPGFLVQAERTGVRACVAQSDMAYLVTSQFICTRADLASGARYTFTTDGPAYGPVAIVRFGTPMFGYANVIPSR